LVENNMNKKILITGGTGFLGSNLTRYLVQEGYSVTVFDNDYRGSKKRLSDIKNDFEFIKGDIRNSTHVNKALRNKNIVFHLAYINGTEFFYSKPELVLEVAVKGMMNVMDSAIKNKVEQIYYASSSEVYNEPKMFPTDESATLLIPDPKNPRFSYSGGKIISELIALNYGKKYFKKTVIFRPHNVYGPDMGNEHVIPQFSKRMNELKNKKGSNFVFPIQGSGKESRAYIYVDDFIKGIGFLLKKGKNLEIYNIGTSKETTTTQLAEKIAKILQVKIKIKPGKILEGSAKRRVPDISKIQMLGFSPSVTLEEGLLKTVNWYVDKEN